MIALGLECVSLWLRGIDLYLSSILRRNNIINDIEYC